MEKAEHINKRHNVSLIMYHFVCPTKYRRLVLNDEIDNYIKVLCLDIELRYEIKFLEIWLDWDFSSMNTKFKSYTDNNNYKKYNLKKSMKKA